MQLFGEVWNVRAGGAKVYFELRDARGALPCSIWRSDLEGLALGEPLADGVQVVAAGGCDYYPGSATASPSFSFLVESLHVAGEGDLLAQLDRLRKLLDAEGLLTPQKLLARPLLPRSIGVVTGETGKARDDVLAGLRRRGWAGRIVWGFAPVQDRHAATRIRQALQDLAAFADVDVIIVARGGGSLADLFAFCDETLCRTVALLPVPVIASVGHHTDRTLLDDVAAASCSTPTHAAETAVGLDCNAARSELTGHARRLHSHGRRALLERARALARLSRAPAEHVARHRRRLHQQLRELRASARRHAREERMLTARRLLVLGRKAHTGELDRARESLSLQQRSTGLRRAGSASCERRRDSLQRLALALAPHDPARTLRRGYALVRDRDGRLLTSVASARAARDLEIELADGRFGAHVAEDAGTRDGG